MQIFFEVFIEDNFLYFTVIQVLIRVQGWHEKPRAQKMMENTFLMDNIDFLKTMNQTFVSIPIVLTFQMGTYYLF